jgi:hypothetical protein
VDILLKILAGLAIAILSSSFTVYLSLAKFRTEKWWEKKAEAYSNLLGVLHDAKAFSEENLEAQYRDRELTKEEDKAVRLKSKKSESDIYRSMDVGAFYLSDSAIACLKIYKNESTEASKQNSWIGYLTLDLDATNKCLKSMIKIAKVDLQIKT